MSKRIVGWLVLAVLCTSPLPAKEAEDPYRTKPLPKDWQEEVVEHTKDTVANIASKLRVPLRRLTVRKLNVSGLRADVNIIDTPDKPSANKLNKMLLDMRGPDFIRRGGETQMIEVANTTNVLLASAVFGWLGTESYKEATYDVEASLGLVDAAKHDYMEANPVFNHFLGIDKGVDVETHRAAIQEKTKDWGHGNALVLFTGPRLGERADWAFEPQASQGPLGMATRFAFAKTQEREGVRFVEAKGRVTVRARFQPAEVEGDKGSTEATKWWPAEHERVQAVAKKLTASATTPRERVLAILAYVHRGMRYHGQVGSRYGVLQAMEQGYGHCWDKSDVLVTLCRAAGIPARQWAGWVPAMKSGHVWAEVHLQGEGWIPVDATTPWLGTSHHYVPMFMSDDGHMPIVYVRWPKVTQRFIARSPK